MQLAYTLGEWNDPQAGQALGQLAVREAGDRFLSAAVMSSVMLRSGVLRSGVPSPRCTHNPAILPSPSSSYFTRRQTGALECHGVRVG